MKSIFVDVNEFSFDQIDSSYIDKNVNLNNSFFQNNKNQNKQDIY